MRVPVIHKTIVHYYAPDYVNQTALDYQQQQQQQSAYANTAKPVSGATLLAPLLPSLELPQSPVASKVDKSRQTFDPGKSDSVEQAALESGEAPQEGGSNQQDGDQLGGLEQRQKQTMKSATAQHQHQQQQQMTDNANITTTRTTTKSSTGKLIARLQVKPTTIKGQSYNKLGG